MKRLSELPRTKGFKFTGIRHSGERVELEFFGDEPRFIAGTAHDELCDNWVMNAELAGWEPYTPPTQTTERV